MCTTHLVSRVTGNSRLDSVSLSSRKLPTLCSLAEFYLLIISRSGIYVPDDERWPAHFRGMAIRIEDSVCVQPESPLIFTTEAVKEVSFKV